MLDRTLMPPIREIAHVRIPRPELYFLSNGIPVYDSCMGTQDLVKMEIVFYAGRPFEHKKLASRVTAALIREGAGKHSSAEIAEWLDFYGCSLTISAGMDMGGVLMYSLHRHLEKVLPLLAELLSVPTFPEKELEAYVERNKRRLQVELTKNDVLAYRKFTEMLYGDEHPYGYNSYPETYDALTRDDLVRHFEENYTAGNCIIFLSGKTGPAVRQMLETHLGQALRHGPRRELEVPPAKTQPEKVRFSPPKDSVQAAIRVGMPLFRRNHPDHNGIYVLNTILGGYFGSRLMANIREKKGYTYNIYSTHDALLYDGYFYIGTEVGTEFVEPTLREIYHELDRLQDKLIGKNELAMVRNYLVGNLLTNLDGPFNVSEAVKTFVAEGLPLDAFEEMVAAIKTVSAKELRELARRYFQQDKMWEVVV